MRSWISSIRAKGGRVWTCRVTFGIGASDKLCAIHAPGDNGCQPACVEMA
jgi:hypothetical protein